jgi:signal-transduction protein with cAMP-binding, CBS, and nucleotidyltransferase domain
VTQERAAHCAQTGTAEDEEVEMRIGEICRSPVVTCRRETGVPQLALLMREHHVGAVIVVDEDDGRMLPIGIVTDRDLVVRVLAERIDPALLHAGDLLSGEIVTIDHREGIYDAIWHMRSKRVRRLPVVDARCHLVGVLTMDDVTRFLAEEMSDMSRIVPNQIEREGAGKAACSVTRNSSETRSRAAPRGVGSKEP